MKNTRNGRQRQSSRQKANPYYIDVANNLRREIVEGDFRPGYRIFTQRQLIEKYGRSLPTIRSALEILVAENLIEAKPRSGYYLTDKIDDLRADRLRKILVVMPAYTSPIESHFTGRLISGLLNRAKQEETVVSFYQRNASTPRETTDTLSEVEQILSLGPNGIIWLHAIPRQKPILLELENRNIPVVLSMRQIEGCRFPMVREDDTIFASIVLSYLLGRGHRKLCILAEKVVDEYYRSKVTAMREVAELLGMTISNEDFFQSETDLTHRQWSEHFESYIRGKTDVKGFVILAPLLIELFYDIMEAHHSDFLEECDVICNILDGVDVSEVRRKRRFVEITPPLELLGTRLFNVLDKLMSGQELNSGPQLISQLRIRG